MFGLEKRRRNRIKGEPFPAAWSEVLIGIPVYRAVNEEDRAELRGHIAVFLDEKTFEGCAGLVITDLIRVTVAAHACILLLRRETDYYPNCNTILIYPEEYIAKGKMMGPGGMVIETEQVRAGESWQGAFAPMSGGPVVLSWRSVKVGAHCPNDGNNVVFHEFAHQLDSESGGMDGAPRLDQRSQYIPWARVLGSEYEALVRASGDGHGTLINPYGATNPPEFFAVCTEFFFERGRELRARHPALYEQLAVYYKQDPAGWNVAAACETS